jgi:hypothetical protein
LHVVMPDLWGTQKSAERWVERLLNNNPLSSNSNDNPRSPNSANNPLCSNNNYRAKGVVPPFYAFLNYRLEALHARRGYRLPMCVTCRPLDDFADIQKTLAQQLLRVWGDTLLELGTAANFHVVETSECGRSVCI